MAQETCAVYMAMKFTWFSFLSDEKIKCDIEIIIISIPILFMFKFMYQYSPIEASTSPYPGHLTPFQVRSRADFHVGW